jgi:hypothetical protein
VREMSFAKHPDDSSKMNMLRAQLRSSHVEVLMSTVEPNTPGQVA